MGTVTCCDRPARGYCLVYGRCSVSDLQTLAIGGRAPVSGVPPVADRLAIAHKGTVSGYSRFAVRDLSAERVLDTDGDLAAACDLNPEPVGAILTETPQVLSFWATRAGVLARITRRGDQERSARPVWGSGQVSTSPRWRGTHHTGPLSRPDLLHAENRSRTQPGQLASPPGQEQTLP